MHRDRFPEDERPGFSSFAAGRSSHGFSSAGAAVPNASRQRMLAGRSLPRGMFRSLSDRIGYGAQEGTVRAASDECAALPSNTAGLSPMRGPLLSRFFGCPGAAARISPRARTFPPRCRTAGPCAFLTEGRSGRSLRNAPRGRDLRRRINRGPHGSEEPRSAAGAAFRNRPDSLSGLYEKSYSSETDAGVAADEWQPARSRGAANLRFAGCRFADGGGIVKRDEKTIPLRRVLAGLPVSERAASARRCRAARKKHLFLRRVLSGLPAVRVCGFGSTVPCSAEKAPVSPPGLSGCCLCRSVRLRLDGAVQCGKSTCFSAGSYRVCLLSGCAASAQRCRAVRKKHLFLRRVLAGVACVGACGFGSTVPCSAEKAPVSPPGLIGFACCQGVRLRLNGAVQCGKSTCFSVGSYRVCLLSECAASARRCRAARKKAPVSLSGLIRFTCCRSVRLRLFWGVGRRTSRWCGCVPRTRRARWCCGT